AVDKPEVIMDDLFTSQSLQPAKTRPKRLKVIKAKSGAERMKAATAKPSAGTGLELKGLSS
ncbi:electron transfer flavoprotein subunit beta, partial [Pseudomonas syringae pv. tagetis]